MKNLPFIRVHSGRRLVLAATLAFLVAGAGFGADPLKPRKSIKKPKTTAIDRTGQFSDRISVKFLDDSKVRLREGKMMDFGTGALDQAATLLQALDAAGAKWEREHLLSEELLEELREKGQTNTGKALPDLNTAFILHLPNSSNAAAVLDELNLLEAVEIALPVPKPAPSPWFRTMNRNKAI